jgi:hypothetical protein
MELRCPLIRACVRTSSNQLSDMLLTHHNPLTVCLRDGWFTRRWITSTDLEWDLLNGLTPNLSLLRRTLRKHARLRSTRLRWLGRSEWERWDQAHPQLARRSLRLWLHQTHDACASSQESPPPPQPPRWRLPQRQPRMKPMCSCAHLRGEEQRHGY